MNLVGYGILEFLLLPVSRISHGESRLDLSLVQYNTTIMPLSTDSGKQSHLRCTGDVLETANAYADEADITLFGSRFCPSVQRTWVAFE